MPQSDPLVRLLQSADAATNMPRSNDDLVSRVRQRRAARARQSKQVGFAIGSVAVAILAGVAIRTWKPPTEPGANAPNKNEIAVLRAQADALAVEADALEHELALARSCEVRQLLREEHKSHLEAQFERQSTLDSVDRAALVGLSQGDFYRDVRQSTDEARAAYESVIDYFPNSQWAAIAQTRIGQLRMN